MSKFNLKIETNFIKYCMGKGEWGITLVELGKEWGRVIELYGICCAYIFINSCREYMHKIERLQHNVENG